MLRPVRLARCMHRIARCIPRRRSFMNRLHAVVRKCGLPAMAATLLMALSGTFQPINAQIYEWLDQAGDRHFENSLEQVPEAQRAQARAVVSAAITGSASRPTDESVP